MKAVFFDLFETLITEKTRSDFRARPGFHERLGTTEARSRRWWREHERDCMIGRFPSCLARFTDMCRATGSTLTDAAITAAAREHEAWKVQVLRDVDPQVFQMLRTVRARGLKIGLISNALPEEVRAWETCPLRDHVAPVLFSCSVGMMKPDPEIYAAACAEMGVRPTEAYFVGDGGYDELRGAAAVGMQPIQVTWYLNREIEWTHTTPLQKVHTLRDLSF